MSVRRVMGTEVEYGISVPGQPGANPMVTSSQIVNAYGARPELNRGGRARWDYEEESPLRDARGFTYSGALYDPSEALADEDLGLANVILTNGARLYVDHAHPEYSTPEVTNPRDAVLWDKAGERVMLEAMRRAAQLPGAAPIQLYKNNTDNKGVSYGCHENYLMSRQTPFAEIVRYLTPFFVSRQVVCGQGRVGLGQDGRGEGFQISQRADFFEVEVGLETTLKRPIINTRDEPHADADKYRRLHVIIGDANLAETSTYLKLGATSLVLDLIEEGPQFGLDLLERDPMECAEILDWPAKLRLLEGFRNRENLGWSAPRLHLVDLQYSDVRLDKGLYNRLVARGSMKRLVTEQQVLDAVDNPPTDTRAYFRGECLRRFGADIAAPSWGSVIFDLGGDSLVRIPTLEPLRGSKAHVGALLESAQTAAELVDQLTTS